MKRFTVRSPYDLKQFLAQSLSISKGKAKELIDARLVFVNNARVWIASHKLRAGDRVEVAAVPPSAGAKRLEILYEDDYVVAVNKPPGMVVNQSSNSVEEQLRRERKAPDIQAIHRLDRDTSGVLLFARNQAAFERAKALWQEHQVKKTYLAICHGRSRFRETNVALPVDGKRAFSRIALVRSSGGYSLFQVETATGRKHQIRLHLRSVRHPIVGDKEYGLRHVPDPQTRSIGRQMLHCARISLPALGSDKRLEIGAPLFPDFRLLGIRLGLLKKDMATAGT